MARVTALLTLVVALNSPAPPQERPSLVRIDVRAGMSGGLGWALASSAVERDSERVYELVLGATGQPGDGAIWVLQLTSDGTLLKEGRITPDGSGVTGQRSRYDHFGMSVAIAPDLDANGVRDSANIAGTLPENE